MQNDDISKLCALLGFVSPSVPDWTTASDEEKQAYCVACKPYDDFVRRVRNSNILLIDGTIRLYYSTLWKWFVEFYNIESEPQKEKAELKTKAEEKATEQPTNDTANDEAPADGLELVEIPGGVAVVGGYYDTLRNRKQIKTHGAKWNKEAKQWQATDPEAVERLRKWFGMTEPTAEEVERMTRFYALVSDIARIFEEIATAAAKEAQRAKESADKKAESEQLRAAIAQMSAQVAEMAERLRTMSARLNELEADNGTASNNETHPEEQANERQEGGKDKPGTLNMLRAAAEDVERLAAANEHTAALLAQLYALAAVGVSVRPLIERAKAIESAHGRGYITPEEVADRYQISQEAKQKAALFLTPEEFRTMYGHDPQTDGKAA